MKVHAKRSLGQNFLQDENVVKRIVSAVDPGKNDTVVEIGPGLGALTRPLIERARQIIAIEFDRDMVSRLRSTFAEEAAFRLVEADALSIDLSSLFTGHDSNNTKLVANLPYNISTPILRKLVEDRLHFERLVLMFQREVADRIVTMPSTKERGFLSVISQAAFEIERLFDVEPAAFRPRPKVWSSILRLIPKPKSLADDPDFKRLISLGFRQKRKTLYNNLKSEISNLELHLNAANIDGRRRAESLNFDEWICLADNISQI